VDVAEPPIIQREFDNAICAARSAAQMAENGKNRLAIFTIFRLGQTDVNTYSLYIFFFNKP